MNIHEEVMLSDTTLSIHEQVMYADPPLGRTAVYRCYDASRNLLYVGMTVGPKQRLADHRRTAPWWPLVDQSRTYISWYRSRRAAQRAEREAIRAESPVWNQRDW